MARGAKAIARKDGRGKAVVEERCSFSVNGERLSGDGSGPKVYWAELGKERHGLAFGASEPKLWYSDRLGAHGP